MVHCLLSQQWGALPVLSSNTTWGERVARSHCINHLGRLFVFCMSSEINSSSNQRRNILKDFTWDYLDKCVAVILGFRVFRWLYVSIKFVHSLKHFGKTVDKILPQNPDLSLSCWVHCLVGWWIALMKCLLWAAAPYTVGKFIHFRSTWARPAPPPCLSQLAC